MAKKRKFWKEVRTLYKADKVNKEGFPAYSGTPEMDVVNVLMTGSTANSFYVNALEKVEDIVRVLTEFENTEFLGKATVYAREQGYVREIPVVSTVVLSTKDLDIFRKVVHRVCLLPTDWQKLIDVARSGMIRQGVGRALKREIIEALRNMSVYHAIKYPKAVEDMINIARPHESVNPVVIKYIKERETSGDPQLEALERLKRTENEDEIVRIIEEGRLPYEVVTGSVKKMTPKIWEALLYQAPYFNLLRNLRNFLEYGVFYKADNLIYAVKKLTNKEAIRKAKLFPFRYYVAWKKIRSSRCMIPEIKNSLLKALEKAMELSVDNVPELDGKVCIAPDVSGSMDSKVLGEYSMLRCKDIVGVYTAIMIKKCKKLPVVLPFESRVRLDLVEEALGKDRLMDIAKTIGVAIGGTSLSAPVEYLLEEKIDVDYFIAFTDNEEWVGRGFMEAFMEYKRKINPEVKAYLVTLIPYRDYPTPPNIPNVYYIFGWSDNALRFIGYDVETQISEIEKLEL